MKRVLALSICLVMLLSLVPAGAVADFYFSPDGTLLGTDPNAIVSEVPAAEEGFGVQNAGCAHAAGSPVQENYNAPSCRAEGSCDYVTYCSLCGTELNREHRTLTAAHKWAPNGECTVCGKSTEEETVHVYPSDNLSKVVVYGKVPEGIEVKMEPARFSLQEFAYTFPADTTVADLEAGEVRIYDLTMEYENTGVKFQPDYQLNVTVNPGFEKDEKIHLYHIYEKQVGSTKDGEPIYRTVADELKCEIRRTTEDGTNVARITFAADVGERYALYSEAELIQRLAKRLAALPTDIVALEEEDTEKALELEKQLLAIEGITAILAETYDYNELWESPELDWTNYNFLRGVLDAFLEIGQKEELTAVLADGSEVKAEGLFPADAVLTVEETELSEAEYAVVFPKEEAEEVTAENTAGVIPETEEAVAVEAAENRETVEDTETAAETVNIPYIAYTMTIRSRGEKWLPEERETVTYKFHVPSGLEAGTEEGTETELKLAGVLSTADGTVFSEQLPVEKTEAGEAAFAEVGAQKYVLYAVQKEIELIDQEITAVCEEDGASVTITGRIPVGATASITKVELTYEEVSEMLGEEAAQAMSDYVVYDICILNEEGNEWEPDDTVSVVITEPSLEVKEDETVTVSHVKNDGEVSDLEAELTTGGEVTFSSDEGFSLHILASRYTVDFFYGDAEYHMPGGSKMTLSKLFEKLGIALPEGNTVAEVTFSNPELVEVSKTEEDDWQLRSLVPFDTNEMLIIVLSDGSRIAIKVTDDLPHMYDYEHRPNIIYADFVNLCTHSGGFPSFVSTTSKNGPNGYPYVWFASKQIVYPYGTDNKYDLYLAGRDSATISSENSTVVSVNKPIVMWIEDGNGNKVNLDDVCLGNFGFATLLAWQYDLGRNNSIYTNDKELVFISSDPNSKETSEKMPAQDYVRPSAGVGGTILSHTGLFQGVVSNNDGYYYASLVSGGCDEISVFQIHNGLNEIVMKKQVNDIENPQQTHSGTFNVKWCDGNGNEKEWPEGAKLREVIKTEIGGVIEYKIGTVYTTYDGLADYLSKHGFSQSHNDGVKETGILSPEIKAGTTEYLLIEEVPASGDEPISVSPASSKHYFMVEMLSNYATITYIGSTMNSVN